MGRDSPLFTLSYVNEPFGKTTRLDKQFKSMIHLMAWIKHHHPEYTSYQIIVVRRGK